MLASIQGILQRIRRRRPGARRRRGTPVREPNGEGHARCGSGENSPQAFRDLGGSTHMLFEELAVRAETDDMDSLARDAAQLMNQCLACHAAFRVH